MSGQYGHLSLRDNLDLTTPAGRMMFHAIGAMAEFERELIRERVKAGLVHARAKGVRLGRPKVKRDRDKDAKVIRQCVQTVIVTARSPTRSAGRRLTSTVSA